ncbi:hypothetical protein OPV22_014238 [Ensete ventricosum]|uniref:Uncharacterized protein n=1 Tax=Ensete ventricosum TaxID=4639 RepID=A0AAV8QXA7_ENSVE|nr:hypothetical protein OPV22_014238 [Ensete ventricosum]
MDSLICPFDGKGRSCGEVELVELCVYAVISVKRIGTAKLQEGIFAFDGGSRNKGTKEPEDLWGGVVVLIRRPKRKKTAKRGREFSISPAGLLLPTFTSFSIPYIFCVRLDIGKRVLELKKDKIQSGRSEEEEEA